MRNTDISFVLSLFVCSLKAEKVLFFYQEKKHWWRIYNEFHLVQQCLERL